MLQRIPSRSDRDPCPSYWQLLFLMSYIQFDTDKPMLTQDTGRRAATYFARFTTTASVYHLIIPIICQQLWAHRICYFSKFNGSINNRRISHCPHFIFPFCPPFTSCNSKWCIGMSVFSSQIKFRFPLTFKKGYCCHRLQQLPISFAAEFWHFSTVNIHSTFHKSYQHCCIYSPGRTLN